METEKYLKAVSQTVPQLHKSLRYLNDEDAFSQLRATMKFFLHSMVFRDIILSAQLKKYHFVKRNLLAVFRTVEVLDLIKYRSLCTIFINHVKRFDVLKMVQQVIIFLFSKLNQKLCMKNNLNEEVSGSDNRESGQ